MLKLVAFTFLFALASARPQDVDSNRIVALPNDDLLVTDIGFEKIEAKPAPEVVSVDASYAYGVDLSVPATLSQMNCLKTSRYAAVFVRAFTPTGSGAFDTTSINNIRNAYSAGLGIENYMTPQPLSSLQGYQQLDLLYNGLHNNGITVRSVWIQVTSPANWQKPQPPMSISSIALSLITGNWATLSSDVLLWYWHVLGGGVTGETPATFDDFRAFGSFKAASVKQFAQVESVCSLTVNRDVYAVGIPAAAKSNVSGKFADVITDNNKIVVGGVVGV
uniref:GH26 domain-containing protein n=1 Tax=Caenorhabditis tropicalis TaxID=1561998 RepID=A0A1I7T5V1_9PELO